MKAGEEGGSGKSTAFSFRPSKLSSVGEKIQESWASEKPSVSGTSGGTSIFGSSLFSKPTKPTEAAKPESAKEGESGKVTTAYQPPTQAPPAYVFGSNINKRVVADEPPVQTANDSQEDLFKESSDESVSGKSNLFGNLAARAESGNGEAGEGSSGGAEERLKAEAARLAEEKATVHPPPSETETAPPATGEEDETNLFHTQAKLHQFVKEEERWAERASGQLKVNRRRTSGETRLVMRAAGSQRLVLNSRLWHDMLLTRLTSKRLKISGTDPASPSDIALFLITCSEGESRKLESLLEEEKAKLPVPMPTPTPTPSAPDTDTSQGAEEGRKRKAGEEVKEEEGESGKPEAKKVLQ